MRYLIFGGELDGAHGGAYDLIGAHTDREGAEGLARQALGQFAIREDENGKPIPGDIEWVHIFDIEKGQITFALHSALGHQLLVQEIVSFEERNRILFGEKR